MFELPRSYRMDQIKGYIYGTETFTFKVLQQKIMKKIKY